VLAYPIVLILIRVFETHLIFFPNYPNRLAGDWNPKGLAVQDVSLRSSDGVKLHAWWIPNDKATFTFLAFHGNAGNMADRADIYKFLGEIPASVLAVEYRGYGRSEGSPSENGVYLDAQGAYEYLVTSKGIQPKRIISFGQSLGTAVAVDLAAHKQVGGVVLEAPFPSAAAVARISFWFLPGLSLLVRSQFDTKAKLRRIESPLMVVHCTQDPVLPYAFGEEVYVAAQSRKLFLKIEGYCHEEASVIAPERYRAALNGFLNTL